MNVEKYKRIGIVVGVVAALIAVMMLALWASDSPEQRVSARHQPKEVKTFVTVGEKVDPAEVWVAQSESEISDLKKKNAELTQMLDRLGRELETLNDRQKKAEDKFKENSSSSSNETGYPEAKALPPSFFPFSNSNNADGANPFVSAVAEDLTRKPEDKKDIEPPSFAIVSVNLAKPVQPETSQQTATVKKSEKNIENFLPAGSFITATMLSGANAPTGGGGATTPVPVLFQMDTDGSLPNQFTSRVRECRITASMYGDLASERAYPRTEKMSCIDHEGKILETNIKGYISGEDGMAGMAGKVIEKRGRLIALSMMSGLFSGIGTGMSQGLTTLATNPTTGNVMTVNPKDTMEYGAWTGVGNAMEKLADWYLQRADELYPVIEIKAGRYSEIVLTEGLDLNIDLWGQPEDVKKASK